MSNATLTELELAFVVPRYAHTRIAEPAAVRRLSQSLERFGQLSPVIVVPEDAACEEDLPRRFVLLDGYRRFEALRHLRRDTLLAQVWDLAEPEALLRLLGERRDRPWQAIEEAQLLAELRTRFGLSLERLASRVGHDAAWVSRRLSLVDCLSPEAAAAVAGGQLSPWAAMRVVAPLARANSDHAARLVASLAEAALSTRDLALWWSRYPQANQAERTEMVDHPGAFVRAFHAQSESGSARALAQGPEGQLLRDVRVLSALLRRVRKLLPIVLGPSQSPEERTRLIGSLRALPAILSSLTRLLEELAHEDPTAKAPPDPLARRPERGQKGDCPPSPSQPQDGAPRAPEALGP